MSAITHAEMTANAPTLSDVLNEYIPRAFLWHSVSPAPPYQTPIDWNAIGHAHITNTWAHLGDCIGAIAAYMNADLGLPPPDIENILIADGVYNSSFLSAHPSQSLNYASTGQAFNSAWWNGNGFNKSNWSIPNLEQVFGFSGTIDTAIQTGVYTPSGGEVAEDHHHLLAQHREQPTSTLYFAKFIPQPKQTP